jgi:hypothetical protein
LIASESVFTGRRNGPTVTVVAIGVSGSGEKAVVLQLIEGALYLLGCRAMTGAAAGNMRGVIALDYVTDVNGLRMVR